MKAAHILFIEADNLLERYHQAKALGMSAKILDDLREKYKGAHAVWLAAYLKVIGAAVQA